MTLVSQHCDVSSYYPLYPPSLDVNLDLEAFQKYGSMDVLPHILITPSELSCFIKVNNNCNINNALCDNIFMMLLMLSI